MSNHFHLVVRVDRERALSWSEDEVLERYAKVFKNARAKLEPLTDQARAERIELYRARLYDVSWLMRSLNEHIARRANREDGCTGRFWEGRFKSQPLLDETALLTCMSYVDLNPVRAGIRRGLDDSDFTSIQERLLAAGARTNEAESEDAADDSAEKSASEALRDVDAARLVPFHGEPPRHEGDEPLPMTLADYVELLDWTGRASRSSKPGRVRGAPPALLSRRGIDPEAWLRTMGGSGLRTLGTLGSPDELDALADERGTRWVRGKGWARQLYAAAA